MSEYKDILTLDGKIRSAQPGVTKRKIEAVADLISGAMQGDPVKAGMLQEVMTTSDAPFSAAHLVQSEFLPQFEKAERDWQKVAGVRTVADFRPATLVSIFGDLTGPGVREGGGAARVDEAAPYPYVTVAGKEAFYSRLAKTGAKFGITFETRVNDPAGLWERMPQELLELALDTENVEVWDALKTGVANLGGAADMTGGTLPDGTVVPANAPVTPNAIWQAIMELSNRTVNGRKVGRLSGYNVIVPTGLAPFIEFQLSQTIIAIQDGNVTFGPGDRSVFGGITIVESDQIGLTNPNEWYVLPKPGAYRRPVLELLRLRGYETPELRVNNATGTYLGGGAVAPFEGSFDNDTLDMRLRYVVGGAFWDSGAEAVLYSDGSGS